MPGFWAKILTFFFQLNKMRDEAKTWWLVSGLNMPNVASSYFFFFLKEIRVALESRDSRWYRQYNWSHFLSWDPIVRAAEQCGQMQ